MNKWLTTVTYLIQYNTIWGTYRVFLYNVIYIYTIPYLYTYTYLYICVCMHTHTHYIYNGGCLRWELHYTWKIFYSLYRKVSYFVMGWNNHWKQALYWYLVCVDSYLKHDFGEKSLFHVSSVDSVYCQFLIISTDQSIVVMGKNLNC